MRKTHSPETTKQLAKTLAPYIHPGDVVVLTGDLGAGKTQFAQGLAYGLGIKDDIVSPTFNIMLQYEAGRLPLYHFDLYRLEKSNELQDIGYYDIIEGDGVSLIEWGEKFPDALPYGYLSVAITREPDEVRCVRVHSLGDRARQLLCVWANDSKSRLIRAGNS